jgi:sugar lactone lactonase YvrE/pimeloyl-ACP methyl ester carboxylesterase
VREVSGDLHLETNSGVLIQRKPKVYQEIGGKRVPVGVRYLLDPNSPTVRLEAQEYDHTLPLDVDPELVYATYLGGSLDEQPVGATAAGDGSFAVLMNTQSTDLPMAILAPPGGIMKAVTRLDPKGRFAFTDYYLGDQDFFDGRRYMATDGTGNIYISGGLTRDHQVEFPRTTYIGQDVQPIHFIENDFSYILKIDPSGSLVYGTTFVGWSQSPSVKPFAVDKDGHVYIGCKVNLTNDGYDGHELTKIDANGTSILWDADVGDKDSFTQPFGLAIDSDGGVCILASRNPNAALPPGTVVLSTLDSTSPIFYAARVSSGGAVTARAVFSGWTQPIRYVDLPSIAVDDDNNVYVGGTTKSSKIPIVATPNHTPIMAALPGPPSYSSLFVTKIASDFTRIVYSTYFGGAGGPNEITSGVLIGVDHSSHAIFGGWTVEPFGQGTYPTTIPNQGSIDLGISDLFITRLADDGSKLDYSARVCPLYGGMAFAISGDQVFLAGATLAPDNPTKNAAQEASPGLISPNSDLYIQRLDFGRDLTIFVPGAGGSTLLLGDTMVWPPPIDFTLLLFKSRMSLESGATGLLPGDAIKEVDGFAGAKVRLYKDLIDYLTARGFIEYKIPPTYPMQPCQDSNFDSKPNLFIAPYDWRVSVEESSSLLYQYVKCIHEKNPNKKINFVSHSMGGLVTRWMLMQHPDVTADNTGYIHYVITMGTPWLGAPKAISTLYTGQFTSDQPGGFIDTLVFKSLVQFYAGVHELLPSSEYFFISRTNATFTTDDGVPVQWKGTNVYEENATDFTFDALKAKLDQDFAPSLPGSVTTNFHVGPLQDFSNDRTSVKYVHFIGYVNDGLRATTAVKFHRGRLDRCEPNMQCSPNQEDYVFYGAGDNTVPLISSARPNSFLAPDTQLLWICGDSDDIRNNPASHNAFTHHPQLLSDLLNLLTGTGKKVSGNCGGPSFATTSRSSASKFSSKANSIQSPSNFVHLSGVTAATLLTSSGETIPLADGAGAGHGVIIDQLGPDTWSLILNSGEAFEVQFNAPTVPFTLEIAQGTDNIDPNWRARYRDIVQAAGVPMRLIADVSGAVRLWSNPNGDGHALVLVPPTTLVSGADASDSRPPVISFTGGNSIVIQASDDSSGVATIFYSVDGNLFQTYSQPVPASALLNGTLIAFADDRAGNRSDRFTYSAFKSSQIIQWSKPAGIVYGTPLSSFQLNATVAPSGPSPAGALTYSPASGSVLNVGPQTLTVTSAETANYNAASATVILDVAKAPVAVSWAAPADIVYGTGLSAVQLNATASVAGTFAYTPATGTLLSAGPNQALNVVFTSNDANYQTQSSATVPINVSKATPSVVWSNPTDIVYGAMLSPVQLNATASVAGTFTYAPAAGAVLNAGANQAMSVVFTPNDPNYQTQSAAVQINVAKATPVMIWPQPAAIVYGTALSMTQLNASSNVAGSIAFTPVAGTILGAGTQTLQASFTPADAVNFQAATATVTIAVTKANQTISWANPAGIEYGTPLSSTQLNASVSVVGPAPAGTLTYTPPSGSLLNAGSQTLSVASGETPNYNAASASVVINVHTATPPGYTQVTTFAGGGSVFSQPSGIAITPAGDLIVTDRDHHQIKRISPAGVVTVIAGTGVLGALDGAATVAQFKSPVAVAYDAPRNLIYIADTQSDSIRKIDGSGTVSTFAATGFADPSGLTVDASGNLYVADTGNNKIKKITVAGVVSTIAGAGQAAYLDGPALSAKFSSPYGLAITAGGVLYIADQKNHVIRKLENGTVSTVAGTGSNGLLNGPALSAKFTEPKGIGFDAGGNLIVADSNNEVIRLVTLGASPTVSTIAGTGAVGLVNGSPSSAKFREPSGIVFAGTIFVADAGNDVIRAISTGATNIGTAIALSATVGTGPLQSGLGGR